MNMDWLLITIITVLILAIGWMIFDHNRSVKKDKDIFDEYLELQRQTKLLGRSRRRARRLEK